MENTEIDELIKEIDTLEKQLHAIQEKIRNKKYILNAIEKDLKEKRYSRTGSIKQRENVSFNDLSGKRYNNPMWLAKKEEIFKRDNYKCQMCNGVAQVVPVIKNSIENPSVYESGITLHDISCINIVHP